jgi:signal transduction histidine kinase
MLQDFLKANRAILIDRCHTLAATRAGRPTAPRELPRSAPRYLDQLIEMLAEEETGGAGSITNLGQEPVDTDAVQSELADLTTLHGLDLLDQDFTLEQLIRDYGNVCQAVTNHAYETNASIEITEFRTLNRCLDNAIAAAVAEYAQRQTAVTTRRDFRSESARLGSVLHHLQGDLNTATLVVKAIKTGNIGISGATGSLLDRSLSGMRSLIDRALAEVKLNSGTSARLRPLNLATFLSEVAAAASHDAQARGCHFAFTLPDSDLMLSADAELLSSAVGNLLQNAFEFTKHNTAVHLHAHKMSDRILIEVEDHRGDLPAGTATSQMPSLSRSGEDRSGLDLLFQICRRSVELNKGTLSVRNLLDHGCIVTIDLPRVIDPAE